MQTENKSTNTEELRSSEFPSFEGLEVIGRIGDGGMSTVYKAIQSSLGRTVAVKVLSDQALGEAGILRFKNEAKNTANLVHPNIVKVYLVGVSPAGSAYIVMEYLEGRSLASILSEKPCKYSRRQLANILCQLLYGLDYAHKCGFIHRDLKPANMMIIDGDNGPEAKLVDFGIAKSLGQEAQKLTTTGTIIGTPAYMSPEQCLDRPLDLRSDLYSMACVIYECFVGKIPFNGNNSLELMYNHINGSIPSAASMKDSCGEELANLLNQTFAKSAEDRPASASRMRDALEKALNTIPEHVQEKKTKENYKFKPKEQDLVSGQEEKRQESSKNEKNSRDLAKSQEDKSASSNETEPQGKQKSFGRIVFVVLGAIFMLFLVLKDSFNLEVPKQKGPEGSSENETANSATKKPNPPVLNALAKELIPAESRSLPEHLEYTYQSYCSGLNPLQDWKKSKERFDITINQFVSQTLSEKVRPISGTLEAWTSNIIASKAFDELFNLGERKAVSLRQELADWDQAFHQATLVWPKQNTKPYVGTAYGRFQCMINQSKAKYTEMEKLSPAEQAECLDAQTKLLPKVEKEILAAIAEQEKLAATNESPPEAILCLRQCLFDAYLAADKKTEAEKELKQILELDEKDPGSPSRHFSILLRKARLLPASERQPALDDAARVVLPKLAQKEPIVTWNTQKGAYELKDGDSIANSMELITSNVSSAQQSLICDYLKAVAYNDAGDLANAKKLMKEVRRRGGVIHMPGYDPKLEAELTNEE